MKYRIAIQSIDAKKFKHVHNIMFETDNIERNINDIRLRLSDEIEKNEQLAAEHFNNKSKTIVDELINNTAQDVIDWNAKGSDISKKSYLMNEMRYMDE